MKERMREEQNVSAWLRLAAGIGAILLFMFVIAPLLAEVRPVGALTDFTERRGLDAGAYWWSDSEEYAPAWLLLHDSLKYSGTIRDENH